MWALYKHSTFFFAAAVALTGSAVPDGVGQIWLDDVACTGVEDRLTECRNRGGFGSHNCVHSEDAGVRCAGMLFFFVRFYFIVSVCVIMNVLSSRHFLHYWSHQTSGRDKHSRTCGNLQQKCLGNSV